MGRTLEQLEELVLATPPRESIGLTESEVRHIGVLCHVPRREIEIFLAEDRPLFMLGVRVVVIPEDWAERLDTGKGLT